MNEKSYNDGALIIPNGPSRFQLNPVLYNRFGINLISRKKD